MAFDHDTLLTTLPVFDLNQSPVDDELIHAYFRHYGLDTTSAFPDVTHFFGRINNDSQQLSCHYWQHPHARGTCFILHGYLDHTGLFSKMIQQCLLRHYSVVAFDLPGHGLSSGERASIPHFNDYQIAFQTVLRYFRQHAPHPWRLLSQSTGGAIAMDYLLSEGISAFDKVVLLNPLVRIPKWTQSCVLHSLLKWFIKRIPRHFSRNSQDENFLAFVRYSDPFQSHTIALDWIGALRLWVKRFTFLPNSDFNTLIVQGEADETVDWRYNLDVIRKKFPHSNILRLKTARHHMANEIDDIQAPLWSAIDTYFEHTPSH